MFRRTISLQFSIESKIEQSRPVHIFFITHQRIAVNRPETSPNSFSMFLLSRCPWVCRFFGVASNHHTMLRLDKTTQFGTSNADPNVPMLMLPLFAQVGNRAPGMCSIDSRRKMFYDFFAFEVWHVSPYSFINFLSTKSDNFRFWIPAMSSFFLLPPAIVCSPPLCQEYPSRISPTERRPGWVRSWKTKQFVHVDHVVSSGNDILRYFGQWDGLGSGPLKGRNQMT